MLSGFGAAAQLQDGDTARFAWRVSSTGSITDGNVKRTVINNGFELAHLSGDKKTGFRSSTTYIYGKSNYAETETDMLSRNFFYIYPHKKIYPFAMLWLENNLRRKVDYLVMAGPGATWRAPDAPHHNVKVSLGIFYETKRFVSTAFNDAAFDGKAIQNTWRPTLRVAGEHMFAKRIPLSYEVYYQSSTNELSDYRVHAEGSINVPLWKRLKFRSAIVYNWENVVVLGLRSDDVTWTFGFAVGNF